MPVWTELEDHLQSSRQLGKDADSFHTIDALAAKV